MFLFFFFVGDTNCICEICLLLALLECGKFDFIHSYVLALVLDTFPVDSSMYWHLMLADGLVALLAHFEKSLRKSLNAHLLTIWKLHECEDTTSIGMCV